MFNDLDEAFTALKEHAPQPAFAPPSAVRRRAQRRTHRQIALAAVAVVGVAVGAGALAAGPPSGGRVEPATSTGATTGTGAPAVIPDRLLLQPDDLPALATRYETAGPFASSVDCPADSHAGESWAHQRTGKRHSYRTAIVAHVFQSVFLYEPGWATRGVADHATWFERCPGRRATTMTVLGRDLGGDESVLYRVELTGWQGYLAILRVGDLLTTVTVLDVFTEAEVRDLAAKAARRLAS